MWRKASHARGYHGKRPLGDRLIDEHLNPDTFDGPKLLSALADSPWVRPGQADKSPLLNYLMGSRLLYGMSRQGLLPRILGVLHPVRRSPHAAVILLFVIVSALILSGGVKQLAEATVLLLLTVFTVVNLSLVVLKRRPGEVEIVDGLKEHERVVTEGTQNLRDGSVVNDQQPEAAAADQTSDTSS